MRDTLKDTKILLAEKCISLLESAYRKANTEPRRQPKPKAKEGRRGLQALLTRRVTAS